MLLLLVKNKSKEDGAKIERKSSQSLHSSGNTIVAMVNLVSVTKSRAPREPPNRALHFPCLILRIPLYLNSPKWIKRSREIFGTTP